MAMTITARVPLTHNELAWFQRPAGEHATVADKVTDRRFVVDDQDPRYRNSNVTHPSNVAWQSRSS